MAAKSPLPHSRFSTAAFSPEDRFECWRETLSVFFEPELVAGADIETFHSSVEGFHLGEVLVGAMRADAQRYVRSPSTIRRSGVDHYLVQLYRSGGYGGDVGAGSISLLPGQVSILDLARPLTTQASTSDVINIVIPRDALTSMLPTGFSFDGVVLSGSAGSLLGDYMESLLRNLPRVTTADAPHLARATREIIAACLASSPDLREQARPHIDTVLQGRIRRYIEERLTSPALSPAAITRALGVSRSRLYRLFEPVGGVSHYIQNRRLQAIYRLLASDAQPSRLADIANTYGFADGAHFAKAFKRRFGVSPSDVREASRRSGAAKGAVERPDFDQVWLDEWVRRLHV
ncbi:helix-turn-helix domain-containing protein [Microvirga makkahensis]|uniref:Helix-turn-helix domain-containing protein n=1 Tax=Microvirga makkahensis TaxID=1128670 RepID=A0A7X3MWY7_9HYPH|nr:helix-turn-helix domain-containing protein [Microvirga makkahensis]MXQ14801.1 helix-turn-helix domain-containing protein [Microvirga makkahensis]